MLGVIRLAGKLEFPQNKPSVIDERLNTCRRNIRIEIYSTRSGRASKPESPVYLSLAYLSRSAPLRAAWAAASRAIGTRNGEQDT